jgi:monoamine oxidase
VVNDHGADCDLGPSWFWPGQPLIASLLKYFGLPYYEQFADGDVLLQQPGGTVERSQGPSPMHGSRRIQGGIHRLVDAIVDQIEDSHRFLACQVIGLSVDRDVITVDVDAASGKFQIQTRQAALAIPPRLAAELTFSPALPAQVIQKLTETPTWMASHAKFFAVYETPFWRQQGLSGTAFSQRGPLAEIHDASSASTNHYSLFGFSGLDSASRARLGQAEFIKQATAQLVELFGNGASSPQAVFFQDWSNDRFTAGPDDQVSQSHHPQYGLDLQLGNDWTGRLAFISTEASFSNGGLIEGALESGLNFSRQMTGQDTQFTDDLHTPQ